MICIYRNINKGEHYMKNSQHFRFPVWLRFDSCEPACRHQKRARRSGWKNSVLRHASHLHGEELRHGQMMQARETWMTLMEFASACSSLIFIRSEIILSLNGALKLMKKI